MKKNVIDLGLPAGKLIAQYPDLPGLLAEMGIEDVDAEKTLPEVAADLGVETSVIAFAFFHLWLLMCRVSRPQTTATRARSLT